MGSRTRRISSRQSNLDAVEALVAGRVGIGNRELIGWDCRGGRCERGPKAAARVGFELHVVNAAGRDWAEGEIGLCGQRNSESENGGRVRGIESGDVFEEVILAGAVGVAGGAGLAVGRGAVSA